MNGDKNLPNLCAFWDVTEKNTYIMIIGDISRFCSTTVRNTKNKKKLNSCNRIKCIFYVFRMILGLFRRLLTSLMIFKGYLRYKTITSKNVSSEAQVKNFFISQKSYVPFSSYSSFCIFNHPMIFQICDVMMSISIGDRVHF